MSQKTQQKNIMQMLAKRLSNRQQHNQNNKVSQKVQENQNSEVEQNLVQMKQQPNKKAGKKVQISARSFQSQQYNIYNYDAARTPYQQQSSHSSFQLDSQNDLNEIKNKQRQQKQTIEKVLQRLGLHKKKATIKNQELQIVVNNIIQNCIGTVDEDQNQIIYQEKYGKGYQTRLIDKSLINPKGTLSAALNDPLRKTNGSKGSVIISQLTDLEKIQKIPSYGLYGVYKYIRLIMKKISMICQKIVEHSIFESFILLVIILNSVKMATDDPINSSNNNATIDNVFTGLYTIEMTTKIIAYGFFFAPHAYLKDVWNVLDFIIVSTSLLPLVITLGFSINSLRAIRVLRPLKTITKVKSLKMIVSTLFYSFSLVMDSLYILFFVMVVFGITGTQLFSGVMQNRCMDLLTGIMTDQLCATGDTCNGGLICAQGLNSPNLSIYNFDTFLWSMISVFRTITLEGWSALMINIQKAYSMYAFIYSVLIVFFCEYVLLNMTLAILKYKYSQVKGNTIEEQEVQMNQYQPQFLQKIGIHKQVSKLYNQIPLARYVCDTKIFIGARKFFKVPQIQQQKNYDLTLSRFEGGKKQQRHNTNLKQKKAKLDIQQLKNLGKMQDQKWDSKTLQFESLQFETYQNQPNEQASKKIKTRMNDEINQQEIQDDDDESNEQEQYSESDNQQYSQEGQLDDDISILPSRLEPNDNTHLVRKTSQRFKSVVIQQKKTIPQKIQQKQNKQIIELDAMLKLISQQPTIGINAPTQNNLTIPQVDLQNVQIQRLYERFNDLGEYKIKRAKKSNQLNYFQIKHNKKRILPSVMQKKKNINIIKQITQQTELDLKELQLVNQLSKKELKCRIKSRLVLDQIKSQWMYDSTRVMVSQKIKEVEKKQNQIVQNMNSLTFSVTYKDQAARRLKQQTKKSSIFRRNLDNQLEGLKVPEIIKQRNILPQNIIKGTQRSIVAEANNTYLKLLQNHQMQQKIDMQKDRIMNIFFRRQSNKKRSAIRQVTETQLSPLLQNSQQPQAQQEVSLEEQYALIKQSDIFQRQGRLDLCLPNQSFTQSMQCLLQKINMKQEEYQIYVKGLFGIINVIRKKTLLLVTRPLYDNLMLLVVMMNTVVLAMNGLVDTDQQPYSDINTAFTYIFTVDLVLKIFVYGISFFADIMNLFDAFVVSTSIVEIAFGTGGGGNLSALRAVRILRAFRVLRITRLIRTLRFMKIVMAVVSSIISQFVYIFMLLSLFIFIYTLLGMQIFAGQFLPQSVTGIRQTFDTFFDACFSVFQVLTVQNWNDIQTLVLTSQAGTYYYVYLVSWIFLGNWILLNLLQAILLDGFDQDSDIFKQAEQDDDNEIQEEVKPQTVIKKIGIIQKKDSDMVSIDSQAPDTVYSSADASLFIFLPDSPIRLLAIKISSSFIFEMFILFAIALSSVKLVADTYILKGSAAQSIANIFDLCFNFIFIFESSVKIISQGLLLGDKAYLKNGWSKLDFFIVSTAIIDMTIGVDLSILKLFRTLRPLRIISRNPDMKIIISSLGQSMVGILNVLIIILCVFLMFGILGIFLLEGKLDYCNPSPQLACGNYGPYNTNKTLCQSQGGVWTTQFINFDNIGNSFLSLYVFSTRQNWPYYVFTFMDGSTDGPSLNNSQLMIFVYSVLFIFVCSYFFMDLLVGVLFINFHKAQQKIRPKKLTDKQINWKNLQKIIVQQDPCFELYLQPSNSFNKFFYNIITFKWTDIFVTSCIIGNILIMMIAENDQSTAKSYILDQMNFIFSIVFIIECAFKLGAFGRSYFLSGWNVFDFFVVMASVLDITLEYSGMKSQNSSAISILPQIARIFRVMRVTKLLRMFKRFKGLQKLIETFLFSLPALAKGLSIVCLFFFIASVLASFLLGNITGDYSGSFDQIKNFANFHSAFELLFINTTGENWYFYMYQSIQDGYVICQDGTQGCTQWYYLFFWIIFQFFSQKVFMQLFVLIVLDQFEANYINQHNPLGIFALFQDDFRSKWIQLTAKYHSQKIQSKRLIEFLLVLKQPLGMGKNQLMLKYEQQLRQNQKIKEQQVHKSLAQLDMKLKKSAAKLLNKMTVMKNRMYLGYHQTFYNFAKLSIALQFLDHANIQQKIALEGMHKQSQQTLQKKKPQGNLYFYQQQNNESSQAKQTLNPIQLILFCQMIVKSWHNYSQKFHTSKKQSLQKNKKNINVNQFYNSLNESCASDLQEAIIQKKQVPNRKGHRKGIIERGQITRDIQMLPDLIDHYKNQSRKFKPVRGSIISGQPINKKKNSTRQRDSERKSNRNAPRGALISRRLSGLRLKVSGQLNSSNIQQILKQGNQQKFKIQNLGQK